MEKNIKNILIVGQGATASALAKKLKEYEGVEKIYITTINNIESEKLNTVDLREDDCTGLLKFALEQEIDLTIPISEKALKADIVAFFMSNGQNIFGPTKQACNIATNKAAGKKFIYKMRAQTSRFGIFDKVQAAEDFLSNLTFPVTIKTCEYSNTLDGRLVCPTVSLAKKFLADLGTKNCTDILVEEFTYGKDFTLYFITDGYSAVELASVANYKFTQDGDGGILTDGIGCYSPNNNVSSIVVNRVKNIVNNTLSALEKKGTPYTGILGVEGVLTGEDKFYINEFKPFLQEHDAHAVLNLVEDNLLKIFKACVDGFFADEYEEIKTNNYTSISAMVLARQNNKIIEDFDGVENFEDVDFVNITKTTDGKYLTTKGAIFTLTRIAATLNRAKEYLYEDLAQIKFSGIKYRSDIGGKSDY